MPQSLDPISLETSINGTSRSLRTDPRRTVLEVLREDLQLTGTKYGCGEGSCAACTVLVNGQPVLSCTTTIGEIAGRKVVTIEGLTPEGRESLHPVQQAFLECSGFQCGYCTPGMVLGTVALLSKGASPDDAVIREALNNHICRCCSYVSIVESVKRAAELSAKEARP